ncbi:MAG: signal peptidase I [Bacteroidales bacterium]|nr:signal peptidase I [Bacteroidales bacterium]
MKGKLGYVSVIIFLLLCVFFIRTGFKVFSVEGSSMGNTLFNNDIVLVLNYPSRYVKIENRDILLFKNNNNLFIKRCIAGNTDNVVIKNHEVFCNGVPYVFPEQSKANHTIWYNDKKKYSDEIKRLNLNAYSIWQEDETGANDQLLTKQKVIELEAKSYVDSIRCNSLLLNWEWIKSEHQIYDTSMHLCDTLDAHSYFLIGDHWDESLDSRCFGPINEDEIFGKAIMVLYNADNGRFRWDRFLLLL